ncbi:MAG: hypothetical protein ACYS1A_10895, partial [Planctomycetota bacterium]
VSITLTALFYLLKFSIITQIKINHPTKPFHKPLKKIALASLPRRLFLSNISSPKPSPTAKWVKKIQKNTINAVIFPHFFTKIRVFVHNSRVFGI